VLEAGHIVEHASSGNNSLGNGLLLRADIHTLFDIGLLRIDPETLAVVLSPALANTPYWELNATVLRPRVDGSQPDRLLLEARWAEQAAHARSAAQ
jgi:hypothetical protein